MLDGNRGQVRYSYDYSVMCFHRIYSEENKEHSFVMHVDIIDISYSGIGISGKCELNTGDILLINIAHPNDPTLQFEGIVQWCHFNESEFKAGLMFKNLTRDHILVIHDIIISRTRI